MHPEIQESTPGRCPKCGMDLVMQNSQTQKIVSPVNHGLGILTWKNYIPLAVAVLLITTSSLVVSWRDYQMGEFSIFNLISYFMIGFFLVFAGFKLIDLRGFAKGYFTYDLLAQHFFAYGYIYPFIELGFGLLMLAGIEYPILLWTEFFVMSFSGIGVLIKLLKREEFQCVCLGTFLKVPLTYVTLVEDFGMAILALALIFLS